MPDKPKYSTVKRLYAMSGNVCAFPGCQEPLIHGDKVTGRICHIKGAKLGAARFDADQTSIERHGFENLILMCPRDHDIIDADEKTYTVERLVAMKKEHEKKLASKPPQLDDRLVEQFLAFLSAPPIQHRATIYNQNVTSYGQSGGITAHTVNMVPPRRKLGPKLKQQLRTELPRDQEIVIWFMAGND